MKYRPSTVGGALRGLHRTPISASIARKASFALGVDADTVTNFHENREFLEAAIKELRPSQILELLIELDLLLQQADNTSARYISSSKAINDKLKDALAENRSVLRELSRLVHGDGDGDGDGDVRWNEPVAQLVPAVQALVTELEEQNKELKLARFEAEAAAQSKMDFLANMSHEIRTPMNGIFGMVELVLATPLNEEQKDYVATIQSSTSSLLTVLNDVLEYSKLSNSKVVLDARPFKPRCLAVDVIRTFQASAEEKGLHLQTTTSSLVPETLVGDDHRVRQILFNLIANAIKFTNEGSIRLEVSLCEKNAPEFPRVLSFAVIDTGIGIDSKTIDRLFQPFTQADASTTRNYGGTGLGLAICRQLAEAMLGSLEVKSEVGVGSTFRFEFPLMEEHLSGREEQVDSHCQPRTLLQLCSNQQNATKSILLVEDNPVNQKVTSLIINKLGYSVALASNGQEAVDFVRRAEFSLILMDLSMPVMDGFEASRRIRSLDGPASQTTIIALTGHAFEEHRHRGQEIGIDDFITKPFDLIKLKEKLDHYAG